METRVNDLVLIYHGHNPLGFARVEDIVADVKPGWWQISLMLLKIPPQYVTWILRGEYIDGQEFTMGGEVMRIERMPRPGSPRLVKEEDGDIAAQAITKEEELAEKDERDNVITLRPRKPKPHKPAE